MDDDNSQDNPEFEITEENIQRLKEKYSKEMKDDLQNPVKICMKLIFQSAVERDVQKRIDLSIQLSKFLTSDGGILNLVISLVDFDTSSQQKTTHNQRFIAVSNIITCLPKLCMSYDDYCVNIAKQLKPLIICDNAQYSSLACIIMQSLLNSPHAKPFDVSKLIIKPIHDGLSRSNSVYQPHESITAISNCLQNHLPINQFIRSFPYFLAASITLEPTLSGIKNMIKSSMVSMLNSVSPGAACCLIEEALFHRGDILNIYEEMTTDQGIGLQISSDSFDELDFDDIEDAVMRLLEGCNNQELLLEFFFHFQSYMWSETDAKKINLTAHLVGPLLTSTICENGGKLDLLSAVATNGEKSLNLVLRTLTNYTNYLKSREESEIVEFSRSTRGSLVFSTIMSCVNILEGLYAMKTDDSDRKHMQAKCVGILSQILDLKSDASSSNRSSITTGCLGMLLGENLFDTIEAFMERLGGSDENSEQRAKSTTSLLEQEFNTILRDLNDSLVPVRVHALIRLKQEIMSNEPYALSQIPSLCSKVEGLLADSESYVFLACINLMAEMALRRTNDILPKMIDLYVSSDLELQHRLNIGEVLVKLFKQLNATTPYYAQQVMDMMLKSCFNPEEFIRASSLVNIGEICRNLGDSLGKYIVEILSCIKATLRTDTINVKCAAVDLLRSLLAGLDAVKVEAIQKDLTDINKLLKTIKRRTLDENLCLHADLALDELNRIASELLALDIDATGSKDNKLTKNLKVLSLLD